MYDGKMYISNGKSPENVVQKDERFEGATSKGRLNS